MWISELIIIIKNIIVNIAVDKIYHNLFKSRKNKLTRTEILDIREQRKKEFKEYLYKFEQRSEGSSDIIVRDISRMDEYPDNDDPIFRSKEDHNIIKRIKRYFNDRRISSWFKAELKGTYHRGVELFIYVECIKLLNDEEFVFANSKDENAITVFLVARILFEDLKKVDWNGDEYYYCPHIYCEYNHDRTPYEELVYYSKEEGYEGEYFVERAKYQDVKGLSKKHGFPRHP